MTYKSILVTKRGSSDGLKIVEQELRPPAAGEARVKILAASVTADDIGARVGNRPFLPRIPFVPGYSFIGDVDAVGEGVSAAVGDRVAALTIYGSYAEYIYVRQGDLIPTPKSLNPAEAVPLILNYITAYQMLHRVAKVTAGQKALIIGASGGVGTALLQLGRLAGLKIYGIASGSKHEAICALGAVPIDYHSQDFVEVIHQAEPDGLDVVFDGMFGDYTRRALTVLRRGGNLVGYGAPPSLGSLLAALGYVARHNLLPHSGTIKLYGTSLYRFDKRPFFEDWATLFRLLEEGQIKPIIMQRFPLLEAAKANDLLESGQVTGNLVLLAPEMMNGSGANGRP